MEFTDKEQKLMVQVREDIKQRIRDVLTPPLNYGHDWSTGEYVYPDPALAAERMKLVDDISNIIDNNCKFSFEITPTP